MRRLERSRHLRADDERFRERQHTALEPFSQRLAGDQLEHEEDQPAFLVETVDRRDAGVVEGRQRTRLALEACQPLREVLNPSLALKST
ncbi:MAG TPA: hypothetical protein VNB06_22630 [Thermoanaerobaculia bacterium]|nr:hypothetical protein [Thermoanaerobaculia bacterium]